MRAQALDVILAYRAGGYVRPPAPDDELLAEMMQVLLSEPVPEEYLGLIGEELELDGVDPRAVPWPGATPPGGLDHTHVVVIGAGMSGLLAAIRLGQAGIPYTVVEKNDGVGGTWYENRYPGARVDVGNHFYSYSFAPDDHWSEYFARQPELQAYFEHCLAPLRGGRPRALRHRGPSGRAGTRTAPSGRSRWCRAAPTPTSSPRSSRPTPLISAVGQLNRPKLPAIAGRDDFEGLAMHSARWVDGTELAGRRVAVIGTGASAFQIVPTVAPDTAHLTVFQRSAPWMFPNPNYHAPVGPGVAWAVAPPAVLRPLVPVPAVLARVRRRPGRHARRPRLPASRHRHQRDQRRRPPGLHPVDGRPDR